MIGINTRYEGGCGSDGDSPEQQAPSYQPAPNVRQDVNDQDGYWSQNVVGQDPLTDGHPSHYPDPPGTYAQQQPLYAKPFPSRNPTKPRVWVDAPQSAPDHPSNHLTCDNAYSAQIAGAASQASTQTTAETPTSTQTTADAPTMSGGRASSLLKSSAVMAAGTMVSRITGFIRSALIVAALGSHTLGDTFQIAYQLPTMIYILTVGGGLNSVFVPQLVRAMKEDEDGGEGYANRLLTLVVVALGGLTVLAIFTAPLLVRLLSVETANNPAANKVAVTFVRYCVPTIFFMGIHVVMGQILNARSKFGAMMWTPVLNNVITIAAFAMFIWVYGTSANSRMTVESIPSEGERLLGAGVLLGLAVQALAMIPYLRETGFKLRLRFDWKGHGLGDATRLAKWTIFFVLANQGGAAIVAQLSTAAGANSGIGGTGFIAYANAQLIWGLPQAIITVSLMAALLPRLSRAARDGDVDAVRDDVSQGMRTSAVAIVPVAFSFLALGVPMCTLVFGSSGTQDATSMGYMLMAFSLGLIPYSVQYVVLRAFYAYEDTRTPFFSTAIVATINAGASTLCYFMLPARWAVTGMAASYGLAYAIGVVIAWKRLRKRLGGDLDGPNILRTYARLALASLPAAGLGAAAASAITQGFGQGVLGSLAALTGGAAILFSGFFVAAKRMRIEELNVIVSMMRGRLSR